MTCVVYGVVVYLLSPSMTMVAFVVLGVVAILLVRVMWGIYSLGYLVTGANQEMSSFLIERLKAIRLVRLSNIETAELNALRGHTERQRVRLFPATQASCFVECIDRTDRIGDCIRLTLCCS